MLLIIFLLPLFFSSVTQAHPSQQHSDMSRHTHIHSYNSAYTFDERDGWETVPISNLAYKYVQNNTQGSAPSTQSLHNKSGRRSRTVNQKDQKNHGGAVSSAVKNVVDKTLKGIGRIELVTITWYTGHDLKNPSCWDKAVWAPSDESFACALTLEGWANRPKCFQFLELCNGPGKCVFVRVVDTCAGCAKGSRHVDLTKAPFQALATLDQGVLQVSMRLATEPKEWDEKLWGPKTV